MTYQIHERSQKSIGSGQGKFGGPDTYVAITVAPDGVEVPKYLNRKVLAARGIELIHVGEGYSEHRGRSSALGQSLQRAKDMVEEMQADARCDHAGELLARQ